MHAANFSKIIQMAPLAHDQSVFVSCLREPMLHPQLLDLLRMIPRTLREKFFLTTNLSVRRLTDSFFAELATAQLHHVNVSVDSLQKQTFEQMRVNAKYDVFLENLDTLAAVFAQIPNSPELRFITVAARSNHQEIPSLVRVANERYRVKLYEIRYPFEPGTPAGTWRSCNLLLDSEWEALVSLVMRLRYWTHVSKGTRLLRCGFGQKEVAPAGWGPQDDIVSSSLPWHLPLQLSLGFVRRRLRRTVSKHLGWPLSSRPDIEVSVATTSADGIVHLSGSFAAFALAATNMGHSGTVTLLPIVSDGIDLLVTVCHTEPTTGRCRTDPGGGVITRIEHKGTETFSVFLARQYPADSPISRNAIVDVLFLNERKLCGAARVAIMNS